MLYLSRFQPDRTRTGEFLACLWQGPIPESLTLHKWLYTQDDVREMVLLWEGDAVAHDYVQRNFAAFGELTTEAMTDSTPGLAACFDRDLDGFGAWLSEGGMPGDEVAHQLDVRRQGLAAPSQERAAAAGRAWSGG